MEPQNRSYQPFLIGNGLSKTGLYTYLDSWMKPEDAFDEMENAYVYRGSLYQRDGMSLFPSKSGAGALVYQNNEIVATGAGAINYSGKLSNYPAFGTATITAQSFAEIQFSIATFDPLNPTTVQPWSIGLGLLASAGGINFSTGDWTLTANLGVAIGKPIVIQYNYLPTSGTTPVNNPIMGIVLHQDPNANTQKLYVTDTRRSSRWDTSSASFVPVQSFKQIFWRSNSNATVLNTPALPLLKVQWTNLAPYSVSITDGTTIITDQPGTYPNGTFSPDLTGNLNPLNTSTINYATGEIYLTLLAGVANSNVVYTISGNLQGNYFTGNNTNFFKFVNWQTVENQPSYLYMTNNIDNVTLFDGTNLARPPFAINSANTVSDVNTGEILFPIVNDIQTTQDVKVYKNRLLFLRPTLVGFTPDGQSVRWSQQGNVRFPLGPFNMVSNLAGNGGEVSATTGDWIQTSEFIRDVLVIFFQNTIWIFRYTGNTKDLFRFDKVSGARSTNAPYGSVEYDTYATSMGAKGLIYCNGVNVDRYDETVIDLVQEINQSVFKQCYAQKFDTLNQTWMLYPTDEGGFTTSNKVLVYNFFEKTWAKFNPSMGALVQSPTQPNTLSCLGIGSTARDLTWDDFKVGSQYFSGEGQTWSQATYAWNSFNNQDLSPNLLGGDQNGFVYTMLDGATDNPGPGIQALGINTFVLYKRINPFISQGLKARFGYLDVYYEVNAGTQATFNFYLNNSSEPSLSYLFTFDGEANNNNAWKRIYLSMVGEFIQIEITSVIGQTNTAPIYNTSGSFKVLGLILYAGPAGRLTPGLFL